VHLLLLLQAHDQWLSPELTLTLLLLLLQAHD
jgi:hypothetical protein